MSKVKILGLSASLRSARSKKGYESLVAELKEVKNREELNSYLDDQGNIHLDQFIKAGRGEGRPFDELYKELRSAGGLRGLSNSEIGLAAALWGVLDQEGDIDYLSLAEHFPADGSMRNVEELKDALRKADGFILSTPVYFGDRSSVCQSFIELIRQDDELKDIVQNKIFAGVAVGAKRNGGQETTLIYQLADLIEIGCLGIGNDSQTTSQYGGTGHAGDIGTMPKDEYGVNTCVGTGRRIGRVARILKKAEHYKLADKPKIQVWHLQDRNNEALKMMEPFFDQIKERADVKIISLLEQEIRPCIACDICPIDSGFDEEYRCIIGRKHDGLKVNHKEFLEADIIIPLLFSPVDRKGLQSVYQQFMERTRYLRRGDYVFTDHLVVPMVVNEVGANEKLDLRSLTSGVRHHTVLSAPMVSWVHNGSILNTEQVTARVTKMLDQGTRLLVGRLGAHKEVTSSVAYQPVGYVLSAEKSKEERNLIRREEATKERQARTREAAERRIVAV